MREILNIIEPKILKEMGAWGIVGFTLFTLYRILTNDLSHINSSIEKQSAVQSQTNVVLEKNANVIQGNTDAIKELRATIFSNVKTR